MQTVEERVWQALRKVIDPELGINVVDLGLVYDVRYENGEAEVEMTLTSPGCPLAPVIEAKVKEVMAEIEEIKKLNVELVWDPPWTKEMMSDEIRAELGLD